jgi:thiosulfate/3-mercaptopyruvate sulfurtransferase
VSPEQDGQQLSLELPSDTELRDRLEKLGVSDNSKVVVVFGKGWGSPATRVVWTLQVAGLGDRTQLLDGGSDAWQRAGLPLVTAEPTITRGKLSRPTDRSLVVDHQWMQAHVARPRVRLVDGRAPMFYEGPAIKGRDGSSRPVGHLEGAVNIPFNTLVNDSVQFLPTELLRKAFAAVGVQPGDTVAAYCHIGQQATTVLFVARLLGHPIKLYDGSMNDWENRKLPLVNEKPGTPPSPQPSKQR